MTTTLFSNDNNINAALRACAETLLRAQGVVAVTSHVNGDGDSIGSTLAMLHLLRQLGKTTLLVHPSPVPQNLRFLNGSEEIEPYTPDVHDSALAAAEVLCVLDANAPSRMRGMERAITESRATKLVIDHHQDPQPFADTYAVYPEACSTAELLFRLGEIVGEQYRSKSFAEAVYVGIMTDTGSFRFPRTTAETHRIVAQLMEAGADPVRLHEQTYNQSPLRRSRLLGRALSELGTFYNDKLCVMNVSRFMLEESGASLEDIEGFVEHTLSVAGVQMGILTVELPEEIKISVRSKGSYPANAIASRFGGGGHLNAAGCRARGMTPEETTAELVRLAGEYLGE